MLRKDADGLDFAPYPGDLGQRIYDNVSKEAWQRWLAHQTMLINEYRLTPIEPEARKFLRPEAEVRALVGDVLLGEPRFSSLRRPIFSSSSLRRNSYSCSWKSSTRISLRSCARRSYADHRRASTRVSDRGFALESRR